MARVLQRWGGVALLAVAVSAASELAAQTFGDAINGGPSLEMSSEGGPKTTQPTPSRPNPRKEAADADKEIEAGITALQSGKTDIAVQRFTAALSGGSLPGDLMAKALYHRGVAFRRRGKPVQAISDLTSALWLKNGLDASNRADALAMRAAAYRDAGVPDQVEAEAKKLVAPSAGAPASGAIAARPEADRDAKYSASPSAAPPEATAAASGVGLGSFFDRLFGQASSGSSVSVQTGAVSPTRLPQASSGSVDGAWAERTEVRKGDR